MLSPNDITQVRREIARYLRQFPPAGGGGGLSAPVDATDIADGSVTDTEFQFLNGVTSALQTQLDAKTSIAAALAVQALRP